MFQPIPKLFSLCAQVYVVGHDLLQPYSYFDSYGKYPTCTEENETEFSFIKGSRYQEAGNVFTRKDCSLNIFLDLTVLYCLYERIVSVYSLLFFKTVEMTKNTVGIQNLFFVYNYCVYTLFRSQYFLSKEQLFSIQWIF